MTEIPKLKFKTPELYDNAMVVDEIDYVLDNQSVSPFKASRFLVYPGQISPLDKHQVRETWFISSGKGELIYNESVKCEVSPGDVYYFDSNKSHQLRNTGDEDLVVFAVWWDANKN